MTRVMWGSPTRTIAALFGAACFLAFDLSVSVAVADDPCAFAYEEAQLLRRERRLRRARERLLICAQEMCPATARKDCSSWLAEIDASLSSVVISVIDVDGRERLDVQILYDGERLASGLDGTALAVDPGVHTFRYELPDGRSKEETVAVREGEKNRKLVVSFAPAAAPAPIPSSSPTAPAAPHAPPSASPDSGSPPVLAYVMGGVGVLGIAGFAYFGVQSVNRESELAETCGKTPEGCPEEEVDSVFRQQVAADISLGVALVSLGVMTWILLSDPDPKPKSSFAHATSFPRIPFDVTPTRNGGVATFRGAF